MHACMIMYIYASQWGGHTGHVILKYVGSTASQVSISLQAICTTQHVRILYTCMAFAMHAGKAKSEGSSSDSEASSSSTEIDSGSECEDDAMEDQSVMPLYACTYHAHMLSHADSFHAQRCLLKSLLQICQQMQHHSLWSDHSLWSQLQARLHLQAASYMKTLYMQAPMCARAKWMQVPAFTHRHLWLQASWCILTHVCVLHFMHAHMLYILRYPAKRFAKHRKACKIFAVWRRRSESDTVEGACWAGRVTCPKGLQTRLKMRRSEGPWSMWMSKSRWKSWQSNRLQWFTLLELAKVSGLFSHPCMIITCTAFFIWDDLPLFLPWHALHT